MDDTAVDAAHARMAHLTQKIAETKNAINDANAQLRYLEKEVSDLESWITMWHRLTGQPMKPTAAERIENVSPNVKPMRFKNPDREVVVDHVLQIIQEKQQPQGRKDLFEALKDRNVIIRGKDPEMVLSTMLWRSKDKIVRLQNYGYWPKHVPYEAAHYDPIADDIWGVAARDPEDGVDIRDDDGNTQYDL